MINEGLTNDWPVDVIAAVGAFQQGDLVERPPLFYVGSGRYGIWHLTRELSDPAQAEELFELDPDYCPPYGMITTETCDLTEEDAQPRQPWISVAPVYDATSIMDENMIDLLDRGRLAYLRRVVCDSLPPGIWVVDARIEMPFEKSWLVGRMPIRVCKGQDESQVLAGFLAGRRDRPVLGKALYTDLITPMRRWIEKLSVARRAVVLDGVSEIRLAIAGSPIDPDGVGLIVLSEREPISTPMMHEWDRKWDNWRERLEKDQIALLGNAYKSYDTLSAREYRESIQVPLGLAA